MRDEGGRPGSAIASTVERGERERTAAKATKPDLAMSDPEGGVLSTPEMAVAHRIADMIDHLGGSVKDGSVDDSYWDVATIDEIDAMQMRATAAPLD
jgi:hypothetical protein